MPLEQVVYKNKTKKKKSKTKLEIQKNPRKRNIQNCSLKNSLSRSDLKVII